MDEGHPQVAWTPHSYENISCIHECYESVVWASHMGAQTHAIPPLIHKGRFPYECLRPCRVVAILQCVTRPRDARGVWQLCT